MGMSRRAYARHRDMAENAVRKAILTGRIRLEPDGTIDAVKADRDWATRTDPSQQRAQNASAAERSSREAAMRQNLHSFRPQRVHNYLTTDSQPAA